MTKFERTKNKNIIYEIKEIYGHKFDDCEPYDGYYINAKKEEWFILISNNDLCCEKWGYMSSDDDLKSYEKAELLNIYVTDDKLENFDIPDLYEGNAVFVNVETDKGKFQIAVYNIHNGYYCHPILIYRKTKEIIFEGTV